MVFIGWLSVLCGCGGSVLFQYWLFVFFGCGGISSRRIVDW